MVKKIVQENKKCANEQKMCKGTKNMQTNKKCVSKQKMYKGTKNVQKNKRCAKGPKYYLLWHIMVLNCCVCVVWPFMALCGLVWPCVAFCSLKWSCYCFSRTTPCVSSFDLAFLVWPSVVLCGLFMVLYDIILWQYIVFSRGRGNMSKKCSKKEQKNVQRNKKRSREQKISSPCSSVVKLLPCNPKVPGSIPG